MIRVQQLHCHMSGYVSPHNGMFYAFRGEDPRLTYYIGNGCFASSMKSYDGGWGYYKDKDILMRELKNWFPNEEIVDETLKPELIG